MTKHNELKDQPTAEEIAEARKEGVLDRVQESANLLEAGEESVKGDDPVADLYLGKSEIMQFAHYVDFGLDELKAALDPEADNAIPDNKVAGLLGLERGGKNRTEFVRAYMDRLRVANPKLKSPYEVTNAGPSYTNDTHQVSDL